jgi:enediyne biosynthesis thioesterase
MPAFEYRHVVGFEDTNVVGNVYYANHIRWQGRCREMFLHERVPEIMAELERGLSLVTLRVSCEYFHELLAFDALVIRMRLVELSHHRMKLHFDYWRESKPTLKGDGRAGGSAAGREQAEELVARGEQDLACMRRQGGKLLPEAWPEVMLEALRPYAEG